MRRSCPRPRGLAADNKHHPRRTASCQPAVSVQSPGRGFCRRRPCPACTLTTTTAMRHVPTLLGLHSAIYSLPEIRVHVRLVIRQAVAVLFYARKQLLLSARLSQCNSVCLSVRLFVCPSHGWISQERCKLESPNFTFGCLEDSSFRNCKAFP